MAESFYTKLGRIIHDLQIINMINTVRMQFGNNTNSPDQDLNDISSGYVRQQDTLYRQLVRKCFVDTNKGNVINVKDCSFTVILPQNMYGVMSIHIPAGIVDKIHMGAFPNAVHVTVNIPGHHPMQYPNAGAIHSTRPRTRK